VTDTATELTRDQRLAERVEHLYATDPQFRAAAPLAEVTEAAHRPGLRLSEVVDTTSGRLRRPARAGAARLPGDLRRVDGKHDDDTAVRIRDDHLPRAG
jgi:hypothetical protein